MSETPKCTPQITTAWRTATMVVCCVAIAIAFGMGLHRAKSLGMRTHVPPLVFQSIPAAISLIVFGHSKSYTSLATVSEMYYAELGDQATDASLINATIRRIIVSPLPASDVRYQLLFADDKGIVDFVVVAFRIFGLKSQSTFDLYFLLLLLSSACFTAAYIRHPSHLLLLVSFLIMFYLVLPMIARNPQLNSLLHSRANPILSMVACLHCLLFVLRGSIKPSQMLLVALQFALLIFVLHMRTTTLWQLAAIASLCCITVPIRWWHRYKYPKTLTRDAIAAACFPLLLLLAATGGLHFYRSVVYPDEYQRGEQIMTRPFWHNIFAGFAFHPQFSQRYALRVDDVSVVRATRKFLDEKGRLDEWKSVGGDSTPLSVKHWAAYDKIVKDMIRDRCTTYLSECVSTMTYYKPSSLARNLAWLYGARADPPDLDRFVSPDWGDAVKTQMLDLSRTLDERNMRACLLTPIALILLFPFAVLLAAESKRDQVIALIGAVTLFAGSTLPSVIGYPVAFTLADAGIATGVLLYLCLCLATTNGIQLLRHHIPQFRSACRKG